LWFIASIAFVSLGLVVASITVVIHVRIVADRFILVSKFLEMAESTNYLRSVNSVGKVDFAWSGIVENLNGEILFASFVEFFEQSVVQSFRLVNTFSFGLGDYQPVTLFLGFAIIFGILGHKHFPCNNAQLESQPVSASGLLVLNRQFIVLSVMMSSGSSSIPASPLKICAIRSLVDVDVFGGFNKLANA